AALLQEHDPVADRCGGGHLTDARLPPAEPDPRAAAPLARDRLTTVLGRAERQEPTAPGAQCCSVLSGAAEPSRCRRHRGQRQRSSTLRLAGWKMPTRATSATTAAAAAQVGLASRLLHAVPRWISWAITTM